MVEYSRSLKIRDIRSSYGEKQEAFAARLNRIAKALGLPAVYDYALLSKLENEYRALSIEDVAVYEGVDPVRRSWFELAFGRKKPEIRFTDPELLLPHEPTPEWVEGQRRLDEISAKHRATREAAAATAAASAVEPTTTPTRKSRLKQAAPEQTAPSLQPSPIVRARQQPQRAGVKKPTKKKASGDR